jgi:hypothetical protein
MLSLGDLIVYKETKTDEKNETFVAEIRMRSAWC